jgi:hypothetical protein
VNVRPLSAAVSVLLAALTLLCLALPAAAAAAEPTTLTLEAAPSVVVRGQVTTLTAKIAVPRAELRLSRRYAGESEFKVLGNAVANAQGVATWSRRPVANATYKVEYAGEGDAWSPASAEIDVGVRPRISLRVNASRVLLKGKRITFRVTVRPAHPGGTVVIQRRGKQGWEALKTLTLNDASTARASWRTDRPGRLLVRARMDADAEHRAGVSAGWKSKVLDPRNPYGVPTRYPRLILVDLSQFKLYYHERGQVIRVFDCVLGRPGLPTPKGHFKIYAKDPWMSGAYGPKRLRYLGLYAIHGTNEPWLLKRFPRKYSHGCTRLSNTNIRWLYSRVRVGTPVWNVP